MNNPKVSRPMRVVGILTLLLVCGGILGTWHRPSSPGRSTKESTAVVRQAAKAEFPPASKPSEATGPATLTGEAARQELRKTGQYESLGAAFDNARRAVTMIDPAGPNSRGADYFAANPQQQLRAWFGQSGVELASGAKPVGAGEPWRCRCG